ncbi:META domain-containing protein [Branchiibius sp. NY16-3462-2]|uniref:META domain-containing protein n=1 Tax=Branchiibius sp. NY16-3462-2 TaxID=1807500 RepID=UPI0007979D5C|nr:META domain-containing protein [Branchiibius sp. NY16-3462-2]KYH45332.1 hypothetical protein AZH51_05510 [Branchiibius sp. NY16-3462-2]
MTDGFKPYEEPTADVVGALNGRSFVSSTVTGHDLVADSSISLSFEDGRLAARPGCNNYSGPVAVTDGKIAWSGPAISTRMACSEELMAQDDWFSQLLTDGAELSVGDNALTLTAGDVTLEFSELQPQDEV